MDEDSDVATYELFKQKYRDFHVNEPMGTVNDVVLPFEVERTTRGNLPVYTDFKMNGQQKRT